MAFLKTYKPMKKTFVALALALAAFGPLAQETTQKPEQETVSFKCGLAIDAVFAELDTQTENPVTQEAMGRIDENNGEFICLAADANSIFVAIQPRDINATENRLLFTVDTRSYRVVKTIYSR
jgi:hypothetical protein